MMDEKRRNEILAVSIIVGMLLLMAYLSWASSNSDLGNYDYCIEWESVDEEGLREGVLRRGNLIYTCYSLATLEFKCDYDIDEQTDILEVKPIINTTKEDGLLTSITYGDSNDFNCVRWLKSKNI